jgi:hypothetical protein
MAAGTPYYSDFAEALGSDRAEPVGLTDEDHVEVWHVGVDRDQVVGECHVGDPAGAGIEDRLLQQRHADGHRRGADDLASRGLLVEYPAAVDHRHQA